MPARFARNLEIPFLDDASERSATRSILDQPELLDELEPPLEDVKPEEEETPDDPEPGSSPELELDEEDAEPDDEEEDEAATSSSSPWSYVMSLLPMMALQPTATATKSTPSQVLTRSS